MTRTLYGLLILAAGLAYQGCSSSNNHMLKVTSAPDTAEVYLKRMGTKRVEGSSPLGSAKVASGKHEDPEFVLIGTSPCEYQFKPQIKNVSAGVGGFGGATEYITWTKGIVEVRSDGHKNFQQKVAFNQKGQFIMVHATLEAE
jgi:hypothetical protein